MAALMASSSTVFQSTHLREVRPCLYAYIFTDWSFNPRTYVRCDLLLVDGLDAVFHVSIHAPT